MKARRNRRNLQRLVGPSFHCRDWEKMDKPTQAAVTKMARLAYDAAKKGKI